MAGGCDISNGWIEAAQKRRIKGKAQVYIYWVCAGNVVVPFDPFDDNGGGVLLMDCVAITFFCLLFPFLLFLHYCQCHFFS